MIEWSNLFQFAKRVEVTGKCMKAALWAPFSIPLVGLFYSFFVPMPDRSITSALEVFEYLGLFSFGGLVLGLPFALIYGVPVLWFTSKFWSGRLSRLIATLSLALVPSLLIFDWLRELNYFTQVCMVISLTTALCAQLILFRIETIESR